MLFRGFKYETAGPCPLLQSKCPHRAKADAFAAVDALCLIDDRRTVTCLFQSADGADTYRRARVVLRAAHFIDGQRFIAVLIVIRISDISEKHNATPQKILMGVLYNVSGKASVILLQELQLQILQINISKRYSNNEI